MMHQILTYDLVPDGVPGLTPVLTPDLIERGAEAICVEAFCSRLAEVAGCDLVEVTNLYWMLSDNLRGLVQSREGWAALAQLMVAQPGFSPIMASLH